MTSHLLAAILALLPAPAAPPAPRASASALTVRQAAGQHLIFAYDGLAPPRALEQRIARGEAAGVILFARNVRSTAQVRAVTRRLQRIRRPPGLRAPLIVMADQEGGPVRRIPGAPRRAAAEVTAASQARADGRAAAATLRAAGVNMDLAPVADVPRPGAALERERRTYRRPAGNVGRLATEFARGLERGGVSATAKHFPGFGAAGVNTDLSAQRIATPLDTLRSVDAPPFAALIRAGVDAVMLSTAVYPALDSRPAAFSRRWVTGELRGRMRFGGVTVTDALDTPAVAAYGSLGRRAVLALRAGVDLPLVAGGYALSVAAADGVLAAARRGDLDRATLERGARRVLRLRSRLSR